MIADGYRGTRYVPASRSCGPRAGNQSAKTPWLSTRPRLAHHEAKNTQGVQALAAPDVQAVQYDASN